MKLHRGQDRMHSQLVEHVALSMGVKLPSEPYELSASVKTCAFEDSSWDLMEQACPGVRFPLANSQQQDAGSLSALLTAVCGRRVTVTGVCKIGPNSLGRLFRSRCRLTTCFVAYVGTTYRVLSVCCECRRACDVGCVASAQPLQQAIEQVEWQMMDVEAGVVQEGCWSRSGW